MLARPHDRGASCTKSSKTTPCAASRADIAARSSTACKGICKVRYNEGGVLKVPRGYVAALQVDPIEKKPFFHAYPGALALSFGMLGCDYHCGYCQNWVTSQALRDPVAGARADRRRAGRARAPREAARREGDHLDLQRAADHLGVGGRGVPGGEARPGWSARTSRTATARRECSTTSRRTSTSTRSI